MSGALFAAAPGKDALSVIRRALPCLGSAATSENDCKSDLSSPIAAAPGGLLGVGECLVSVVCVMVDIRRRGRGQLKR